MKNQVIQGDCLEVMKDIPDKSVDSICCDPPYELGFMGKSWDNTGIANNKEMWAECLRVLKPGGYLLSFGGTRTYHRMAVAIEDAGFEVRDMIEWVYGSGFPKSLNIGKAIDKLRGNERKIVDKTFPDGSKPRKTQHIDFYTEKNGIKGNAIYTKGTSEWEGWGTALKPAHEPICMARKPLAEKTVAENVLKYGTGGINIDESRVEAQGEIMSRPFNDINEENVWNSDNSGYKKSGNPNCVSDQLGRFPANLIHDNSEEVRGCFPESTSGAKKANQENYNHDGKEFVATLGASVNEYQASSGNASRFFKSICYCIKKDIGGTALKPAHEPICMARKPLAEKTVAENVLKYGTGGINIDESRVDFVSEADRKESTTKNQHADFGTRPMTNNTVYGDYSMIEPKNFNPTGRFPANIIHDNSEEVRECFPETKSGGGNKNSKDTSTSFLGTGYGGVGTKTDWECDSGNASRFFKSIIYQSKASRSERLLNGFDCAKIEVWKNKDENIEVAVSLAKAILDLVAQNLNIVESGGNITATYPKDFISTIRTIIKKITELKTWNLLMHSPTRDFIVDVFSKKTDGGNLVGYAENSNELMMRIGIFQERVGLATEDVKNAIYQSLLKISEKDAWQEAQSHHPTHKPIALMEYLIKMVTPKGGIVLDPFAGSGTTGVACKNLNRNYILIEKEQEYIDIINKRLE